MLLRLKSLNNPLSPRRRIVKNSLLIRYIKKEQRIGHQGISTFLNALRRFCSTVPILLFHPRKRRIFFTLGSSIKNVPEQQHVVVAAAAAAVCCGAPVAGLPRGLGEGGKELLSRIGREGELGSGEAGELGCGLAL